MADVNASSIEVLAPGSSGNTPPTSVIQEWYTEVLGFQVPRRQSSKRIADRLGLASKVAKLAESHPMIAKIINHGLTSVRGGTVVAGQQMLHGATPEQALETGPEATALGTATGAVAEGVGAAKNAVKGALDTKVVQGPLQNGIRAILGNAADETGVVRSTAPSIRKVAEETADAVYAKSKDQYAVLDAATGGRFQRFKDRLDNIRQALNNLTGTEEDTAQEAKLLKAQKETEDGMQEAFNDAKAKGVDPKLVDEANANFRRSQALYDLDSSIKKAVSGGRPGVTSADTIAKAQELVDPKKFLTRSQQHVRLGQVARCSRRAGSRRPIQPCD